MADDRDRWMNNFICPKCGHKMDLLKDNYCSMDVPKDIIESPLFQLLFKIESWVFEPTFNLAVHLLNEQITLCKMKQSGYSEQFRNTFKNNKICENE